MVTVRDVFFELMRDLNLTTVFGNPGSTEENFLKDFPDDFRYVLALQESSVLAIADGFSQATNRPAFVNLHTAPGLGNALGNLVTTSMNKTPLIVTAGQQTREMLLMEPWLTNVDAASFPRPHVKWAYETVRPQDAPAALMRAYACAVQPPQGPVFLSLPMDDWEKEALPKPVVRTVTTRTAADPDQLIALARALKESHSPALLMGADIDRAGAWDLAVSLAERTRATVFAPPGSERASFPEDHPQFAGALPFAIKPLAEKLRGHDLVVVIGAPVFRYYPFVAGSYLPEGTRLLHVTNDPSEAARAPVGDTIVADAGLVIVELLRHVSQSNRVVPQFNKFATAPAVSAPMTAAALFAAVAKSRPDDMVIVEESPSNLAMLHKHLPTRRPQSFFTMASGGLGFGLPASIGIALGEAVTGRHRPVLAVIGDGSFHYSIQALATAVREKIKLTVLVPRNDEYAILKAFAKQQATPGVPGLDLPPFDLSNLAKGYGCRFQRANTADDVSDLVRGSLKYDGVTIIEAPIDKAIPPLI